MSITIITKSQWTANNNYFRKSGVTLWEKAVANAVYNYNQVLNGNYAPFGVTNAAMQAEKSLVVGYANKIATVARRVGVKFGDEGTVKAPASKQPEVMPTVDEFHDSLLEELGKTNEPKEVTVEMLIAAFDKSIDGKKIEGLSQEQQDQYFEHVASKATSRLTHKVEPALKAVA